MIAFWVGLVLAAVMAPGLFRMLIAMKSRQTVSAFAPEGHQVKQGTPTMGGLLFIIPFLIGVPVVYFLNVWSVLKLDFGETEPHALPAVGLVAAFALIGFIDDYVVPRIWKGKRGLGWKQKIVLQFFAALGYAWLSDSGTWMAWDVLIILAASNAYNFADGLDGLSSSIALALMPGLLVATSNLGAREFWPLLLLLTGAMIPFAFLNAPKAKVFMGDVGSLPVGALFGAAMVAALHPFPLLNGSHVFRGVILWPGDTYRAIPVLSIVLLAELLPVPLQIFSVKVFKRKIFPFTPIHHAFEKAGWPETRVVATFALAQVICTMGAITIMWWYR